MARGKNDAADAAALCEAASRPHMRFVPAKTTDQQAALMLAGQRDRLVRQRTQLVNTIRGHGAEFGLVAAKGSAAIEPLLERLAGADIPTLARELFAGLAEEHAGLCARIAALDRRLRDWHAKNEVALRLTAIPGVGRLIASLLVMKAPNPHLFKSGRDFAAWLGLTPRDHSTAGKARPRAHHPRRRSDAAQLPGRGRDRRDPADPPGRCEEPIRLGCFVATLFAMTVGLVRSVR